MTTVVHRNHPHHRRQQHHHHDHRGIDRLGWITFAVTVAAVVSSASCWVPFSSGNGLWDDLVGKCDGPRNTMDCVRSRLYNYVNDTFESDFNITDGIKFTRNANNYDTVCPGSNETDAPAPGSFREARSSETVSSRIRVYVFPCTPCPRAVLLLSYQRAGEIKGPAALYWCFIIENRWTYTILLNQWRRLSDVNRIRLHTCV